MTTQTKTVLIIVATLVVGIIIGALGSGFVIHRFARHVADARHREIFVEKMVGVIAPAPEQEEAIRDILTRHAEQFAELSDDFHRETSALFDSLRSELDPVLTQEQKERLEERGRRFRRLMKHAGPPRRRPGEGPPPPPRADEDG
jgi:hypothetical protein